MKNNSTFKTSLIIGLIVAAVSAFIFEPLKEKIIKKNNSFLNIEEKDNSTINPTKDQSASLDNKIKKTEVVINSPIDEGLIVQPTNEDSEIYINTSITNTDNKTNIAVTIINENGDELSSIASSIAEIYNQTGNSGNANLIRSPFFHHSSFQKLFEGNSEIIERLKLHNQTDFLALGKISFSIRQGTLVQDTYVCTILLSMNIISVKRKSIIKSFSCTVNGNGVTKDQAKEIAIDKLLNTYISEYSSI